MQTAWSFVFYAIVFPLFCQNAVKQTDKWIVRLNNSTFSYKRNRNDKMIMLYCHIPYNKPDDYKSMHIQYTYTHTYILYKLRIEACISVYISGYTPFAEAGWVSISQINGFSTGLLIEISTAMIPSASLTVRLSRCTEQITSATEREREMMMPWRSAKCQQHSAWHAKRWELENHCNCQNRPTNSYKT